MIITKEEYARWSEADKQVAARGVQKEMICNKDNREYITNIVRKSIEAGEQPSKLVVILTGLYEPFLPEVYRKKYPPVDKAVIEIGFLEDIIRHAREYRWDPESEVARFWFERNKDLGYVLPEKDAPLYLETAIELERLKLEDNEFTVLVCTHGCASVFTVKIPRVGEAVHDKASEDTSDALQPPL